MGIKVEFNIQISDRLVKEINEQATTLGIKRFEYSADSGLIEFNDNVTLGQAMQHIDNFKDRLVRQVP